MIDKNKLKNEYIKLSTPEEIFSDLLDKNEVLSTKIESVEKSIPQDNTKSIFERIEQVKNLIPQVPSLEPLYENIKELKGEITVPYTAEEIRDLISSLKDANRLSVFSLKDTEWLKGAKDIWVQGNIGLSSISGLIEAGTNITITGTGTNTDPFIINSSGGGGGIGGSIAKTQIAYGSAANTITGSANLIFDDVAILQTITHDGLGTVLTQGFLLTNTTAATGGAKIQYSPAINFSGTSFVGGVSQQQDITILCVPTTGGPSFNIYGQQGTGGPNIKLGSFQQNGTSASFTTDQIEVDESVDMLNGGHMVFHGTVSGTVDFSAQSTTTSYVLLLPTAQGAAGSTWINDGSGVLSWGTPSVGLIEMWNGNDINSSIGNNTYTLTLYAEYGMTINELKIISTSGTCTAAVKIGSTSVTGISAVSVSSSIATGTATAANTVATGDKITLVLSSTSSLNNLQWTLKTTRT